MHTTGMVEQQQPYEITSQIQVQARSPYVRVQPKKTVRQGVGDRGDKGWWLCAVGRSCHLPR